MPPSAASEILMTMSWPRLMDGLYKTKVIRHRGPRRSIEEVEFATLVGWTGSTIEDCWMQSDMSHRQNLKRRIIAIGRSQHMQPDSRKYVSGKSRVIRPISLRFCRRYLTSLSSCTVSWSHFNTLWYIENDVA